MTHARILALPLLAALALCGACSSSANAPASTTPPSGTEEASEPTSSAAPEVTDSVVISSREESASEAEPSITVASDGRIVAVWYSTVGTSLRIAYRMSTDDGATFGEIHEMPLAADNNVCANARLTAGDDGTVYLAYACQERTRTGRAAARVLAARSLRGATTFDAPIEVAPANGDTYDQPRVGLVHDGSLIVAYERDNASGWSIVAARTKDFKAFTPVTVFSGSGNSFANFVRVCPSRTTNQVALVAWEYGRGVTLRTSEDSGLTWPAERRVVVSKPGDAAQTTPLQECVAGEGNEVFVMYGLTRTDWQTETLTVIPQLHRLRVVRSADGTAVDSTTDVEEAKGTLLMQPSLARDDAGGIDIAYYAGTSDGDPQGSYRIRRSIDGARTFDSTIVVRESLPFETSRASRRTPGDYMGLWGHDRKLYVAYTDTTGAYGHIAFTRTTPLP